MVIDESSQQQLDREPLSIPLLEKFSNMHEGSYEEVGPSLPTQVVDIESDNNTGGHPSMDQQLYMQYQGEEAPMPGDVDTQ
jgi:hypothetical protein